MEAQSSTRKLTRLRARAHHHAKVANSNALCFEKIGLLKVEIFMEFTDQESIIIIISLSNIQ